MKNTSSIKKHYKRKYKTERQKQSSRSNILLNPLKHRHKHKDVSTDKKLRKNEIIEHNYICWCQYQTQICVTSMTSSVCDTYWGLQLKSSI